MITEGGFFYCGIMNSIFSFCSYFVLEVFGLRLGSIGLFCLAFLFLPVARGSILLRLIDIPFEHATRYHVWLGHVTMAIFTLHGICYIVAWAMQGRLVHEVSSICLFQLFTHIFLSCGHEL